MEERKDHKIYKYTNKINGKVYIGRTCTSLEKRAKKDGKGYARCSYFWNAIQKHGWENFEGEIIEESLTNNEASEKEIFYIEKFEAHNPNKGYNIIKDSREIQDTLRKSMSKSQRNKKLTDSHIEATSNGLKGKYMAESSSRWGEHHTEEAIKKISDANKGVDHINKGVKCVETGEIYKSLREASRKTGINRCYLSNTIKRGSNFTAGGFHWEFVEVPRHNRKRVRCVETGVEYEAAVDAEKYTGIRRGCIGKAAMKGPKYTAGGYHWEFVNKDD